MTSAVVGWATTTDVICGGWGSESDDCVAGEGDGAVGERDGQSEGGCAIMRTFRHAHMLRL